MINRLFHGDCLEVMKSIPSEHIDMIMTDPPYGTTACKWDSIIPLELMWKQIRRIIKLNGAIVMTSSQPFTTTLIHSNIEMFKYCWVWKKSKASDFINCNYRPMKKHEDIVVFSFSNAAPGCKNRMVYNPQGVRYKRTLRNRTGSLGIGRDRDSQQGEYISKGTNYPVSILDMPNEKKTIHPTQKPVALMEYLIETYTHEGDTVLDFAMGSGTTGVACVNLDRNFVGIELDEDYFNVAKDRIEGHQALKLIEQKELSAP